MFSHSPNEQLVTLYGLTNISILAATIAFTSENITQSPQQPVNFYKQEKHNWGNSCKALEE